ncbi:hypothetical protein D3C74_453350 [compost metagenome]
MFLEVDLGLVPWTKIEKCSVTARVGDHNHTIEVMTLGKIERGADGLDTSHVNGCNYSSRPGVVGIVC